MLNKHLAFLFYLIDLNIISIIISRLKKIFPNINNKSYLVEEEAKNQEEILDKITTKAPTFNELINEIKEIDDGKEIDDIWLDVYRYYALDEEYSQRNNNSQPCGTAIQEI